MNENILIVDDEKEIADLIEVYLKNDGYRYGFIYRYPENKVAITGIANEPWHYRYVGVNAATEIYKRGICLEEYLGETN